MRVMKEFPQNGWSRASPDRLIQNNDAYDTTDKRPGSGRPKSARTIDNIAVVQDLICSQDDKVMHPDLYDAPYRSTF